MHDLPALLSLCGFDALDRQPAPVVRLERASRPRRLRKHKNRPIQWTPA